MKEEIKTVSENEFQNICRDFVDREIYSNVSMLMDYFLKNPTTLDNSGHSYEELQEIVSQDNWQETGKNEGWIYDQDRDNDGCIREGIFNEDNELIFDTNGEPCEYDWEQACHNEGINDPVRNEALEFWIVSDWLASKLKQKGCLAGEVFNLEIWGRETSGQAIYIDGVICDIVTEIKNVASSGKF